MTVTSYTFFFPAWPRPIGPISLLFKRHHLLFIFCPFVVTSVLADIIIIQTLDLCKGWVSNSDTAQRDEVLRRYSTACPMYLPGPGTNRQLWIHLLTGVGDSGSVSLAADIIIIQTLVLCSGELALPEPLRLSTWSRTPIRRSPCRDPSST